MKTLVSILILLTSCSSGQKMVKGIVYSKPGPAKGVVVTEVGTSNKVTANEKGEFQIETKTKRPTLVFSHTDSLTAIELNSNFRRLKTENKRELRVKIKSRRLKYSDIAKKQWLQTEPIAYCGVRFIR